jgi:riboflavin biosynthesis pyrimidine reductase
MITPAFGLAKEAEATDAGALANCYGKWQGIRSNHVVTQSGNFSGPDGSSRSISSEADRQLLVALRALADLILVDAATARRELYGLPSAGAALAIFSLTGNFSGIPAVVESSERVFLFSPTPPEGPSARQHQVIASLNNPFQAISIWAGGLGLKSLLLEAGPTLTKNAFANGLVRESAVTISSPQLEIESASRAHPFDPSARLVSLAHSSDSTFTYWTH